MCKLPPYLPLPPTFAPSPPVFLGLSGLSLTPCDRYEKIAWFPVLIVYLVLLGVGGKHLKEAPPPVEPATVGTILSFASVIAGFVVSYAGLMSDFTAYFKPEVSRYVHPRPSPSPRFVRQFGKVHTD